MSQPLLVDVWSDIVCPWCAIGKHRLERALASFAHADEVAIHWRAFELDPAAPRLHEGDNAARLARKYGRTPEQALAMMRHVEETAARDGLELHLTDARSGNTFDAHRVVALGASHGIQDAVVARLFRGYMAEREAIGDRDVLVRLGADAGLDADEVRAVLDGDRFAAAVREDEKLAHSIGVQGVPFFVFGGKFAVSGAQPAHVMAQALEQAWESLPRDLATGAAAACAPDDPAGCA